MPGRANPCRRSALRLAILGACELAACTRDSAARTHWLALDQVRPENHVGVYLNERIQLHFTEALDPASVNAQSVRIVSAADGTPARGDWQVEEDSLIFLPEPVLAFTLDDGGYLPGRTYYVELSGFPRPDGLRGRSGATLERNVRFEFKTVESASRTTDFMFEDSSLSRGLPVVLRTTRIAAGDPIRLEGEEPLDPSTLFSEDFVLRLERTEEQTAEAVRPPLGDPIQLYARLVSNYDKAATPKLGTATIELVPVNRLLEPGKYLLQIDPDRCRLKDFGGNPVPFYVRDPMPRRRLEVVVAKREASGSEVSSEFLESFLKPDMRSLEALDELDGTADWSNTGRVEVHWPAAAGSGIDGVVELAAHESRADIEATRVHVAEGIQCELDPGPGPCVVRAQGKLWIQGTLARRGVLSADANLVAAGDVLSGNGTLTSCLESIQRSGVPMTILIAGGDLVIDGRVRCSGVLVLVAGGRIRAAHADSVSADRLYVLGDGSVENHAHNEPGHPLHLELDPPTSNVLLAPLRLGVMSSPIPPEGRAVRWHVGTQVVSSEPGLVRVRYVGERANAADGRREVIVDDPVALTDCPTLRLRIELWVPSALGWRPPWGNGMYSPASLRREAPKWDPPWLDDVLLHLDQATDRRER